MKIIFMGTPEIARKSLQYLYNEGHDIEAVFTGDDKARGRGMKLSHSPVKELAIKYGTPVYHPADLAACTVSKHCCDLIAVVAFGKILRREILNIPPRGCVNIHGSILPKYRGAAPIQHAILNGEEITGVTSMYMSDGMDDGDIIYTETTPILPEYTSADLFERLGNIGAGLLGKTIKAIEQGSAPRISQNHTQATYAPMLKKEMSPVNFCNSAHAVGCKIRAFIPWPVATMQLGGKTVKIYEAEVTDDTAQEPPGTIIGEKCHGIEVACADKTIIIKKVQAPGGKIIPAADYFRGCRTK